SGFSAGEKKGDAEGDETGGAEIEGVDHHLVRGGKPHVDPEGIEIEDVNECGTNAKDNRVKCQINARRVEYRELLAGCHDSHDDKEDCPLNYKFETHWGS